MFENILLIVVSIFSIIVLIFSIKTLIDTRKIKVNVTSHDFDSGDEFYSITKNKKYSIK